MAAQFREGSGLTMFTSDVSARGVDYPDVSLVVQVCSCLSRTTYLMPAGVLCTNYLSMLHNRNHVHEEDALAVLHARRDQALCLGWA